MATKGPSNRYPTGKRGKNGKSISHTNFEWARAFNKKTLLDHYNRHGKSMGFVNENEYEQHALKFANTIDKKNNVSFIDKDTGATFKFSKKTAEFVLVTKEGIIATYFVPNVTDTYRYYLEQKENKGKGGKK